MHIYYVLQCFYYQQMFDWFPKKEAQTWLEKSVSDVASRRKLKPWIITKTDIFFRFAEEGQPPSYPPSYPPTNPPSSQPFSTSYPSTTDQSFLSSYPSAFGSESGGAAAPPPSYQAAVGQPSASSDSSSYFQSNYGNFSFSFFALLSFQICHIILFQLCQAPPSFIYRLSHKLCPISCDNVHICMNRLGKDYPVHPVSKWKNM